MEKGKGRNFVDGSESVEVLLEMVFTSEEPSTTLVMICMTTPHTNPATFNQFRKELKSKSPELYSKYNSALDFTNKKTKKNKLFNFLNSFKSELGQVIDELKENDLVSQATLLKDGSRSSFTEERKKKECDLLKRIYDLKKPIAYESLNRFKWAKDICEEHNYSEGANFMQNYVDIYNLYLKEYCGEDRKKSW